MKATDLEHVCPCVVLDPETSSTLHMMIAGMEMAVLAKDGLTDSMAQHIFGPHFPMWICRDPCISHSISKATG